MNFGLMKGVGRSGDFRERLDCSVIAIALATGVGYEKAHKALAHMGRKPRHKTPRIYSSGAIANLGFKFDIETPRKPSGSKYTPITIGEYVSSKKKYIAFCRGHMFAIVNGKVEDWTDGRRHRITELWVVSEGKYDE